MRKQLFIFGVGYTGRAVALAALATGWQVAASMRTRPADPPPGLRLVPVAEIGAAFGATTHLLITAAPDEAGDPLLAAAGAAVAAAPCLRWVGYFSTTGVYGDRGGSWVDEATPPAPGSARTRRRIAAEAAWDQAAGARRLDIFRIAGIYGPGRSALDDLRAGTARRVDKPGHCFGRIHRDDIAAAVLAAMAQEGAPSRRVLNLADDEPAESARVVEEAARLLGMPPPPLVPFGQAAASMSPMALSFWGENRRVSSAATKAALGIAWRYPSFREGLRGILACERGRAATAGDGG